MVRKSCDVISHISHVVISLPGSIAGMTRGVCVCAAEWVTESISSVARVWVNATLETDSVSLSYPPSVSHSPALTQPFFALPHSPIKSLLTLFPSHL